MALYPRIVQVTAGSSSEVLNFGGLMVRWSVERTADSRQPTGTVSLFNLREETERRLRNRYDNIRLSAGYPDRFGILVDGQIMDVHRESAGLDRVAHVEVGGRSGYAFRRVVRGRLTTVDVSFEGPVPLQTIVAAIAGRMGLTVESLARIAALGVVVDDYASGLQPAHLLLDELLTPYGLAWYEDTGGVIRFRQTGVVGVGKGGVLHVSEESGMVGKPGITEDGIRVRTLIDHRAELDGLVRVRSRFYPDETAGRWKIIAVRNYGDSREGEAITEMELRSLGDRIAARPSQVVF